MARHSRWRRSRCAHKPRTGCDGESTVCSSGGSRVRRFLGLRGLLRVRFLARILQLCSNCETARSRHPDEFVQRVFPRLKPPRRDTHFCLINYRPYLKDRATKASRVFVAPRYPATLVSLSGGQQLRLIARGGGLIPSYSRTSLAEARPTLACVERSDFGV